MPKKRRLIRKLRHWKQQYDKNAEFIWRRRMFFRGVQTIAGDPIPEELAKNKTKLRRFWESKVIELAEFEAPNVATGVVDKKPVYEEGDNVPVEGVPADVVVTKGKGSWYLIARGDVTEKVNGQKNLDGFVEHIIAEAAKAPVPGDVDDGVSMKNTKDEITAYLEAKDVEFDKNNTKSELLALLEPVAGDNVSDGGDPPK